MNDVIFAGLKFGFGGIGIIFLVVGIGLIVSRNHKRGICTQPISAKIVDMQESHRWDSDGYVSVMWFPVYEYYFNGEKIVKCSNVGGSKQSIHMGKTVEIFINPNNPDEFYCEKDALKFVASVFIGVGAVLIAVAIGVAVLQRNIML